MRLACIWKNVWAESFSAEMCIRDREIKAQSDKIIGLLGLEKFRKAYPHEMSVSMEQRVVIGRAFAMNPDLLLMDEPYGQMDIKMRYFLEDEVIKLWKATGSTVLFITHNLEEAVYLAEKILILSNKPARIKDEVFVDLPRPRDIAAVSYTHLDVYKRQQIHRESQECTGRRPE